MEQVLEWGSMGGAEILGFDGVGSIEEGFAADLVLYDINQPRLSGCHYSAMSPLMAGEP